MNCYSSTILLLLLAALGGRAQQQVDADFDVAARTGIDHVYNLEFESAERDFSRLVELKPNHPAGPFFLAMVQWWKILIDIDNEQYDTQFFDALDRVVDICDSILEKNENDVTAIFFKGGAIGFKGRLKFHRNDYLAAANAGRKALPLVQDASALDPNNVDLLLGSGIYNYYAEVIPNEYPFVKPLLLFIPPGDKKKGMEQLRVAAERGKYASVEATYFLLQIFYFYEKDFMQALVLSENLHSRYPNNMLFHRYLGRCYVSMSNNVRAQEVFAEIADRARRGQRGYNANTEREAEYYMGIGEMNDRRYETALQHFYRCDELSRILDKNEPSGFMTMANLKTGMVYDLLSKRDLALVQYRKVLGMKDYRDSRRQAEQFLQLPYAQ